jgi:hypothetical protein
MRRHKYTANRPLEATITKGIDMYCVYFYTAGGVLIGDYSRAGRPSKKAAGNLITNMFHQTVLKVSKAAGGGNSYFVLTVDGRGYGVEYKKID